MALMLPSEAREILKEIEKYRLGCIITELKGASTEFRAGSVRMGWYNNYAVGIDASGGYHTEVCVLKIRSIDMICRGEIRRVATILDIHF